MGKRERVLIGMVENSDSFAGQGLHLSTKVKVTMGETGGILH